MERVLVCITPQSNSTRLIDKAAEEANSANGELFILNVQKGDNIFGDADSAQMLERLFSYGSKKGGSVHALAGKDVPMMIKNFAVKQKVTTIVLGEPPKNIAVARDSGIIDNLKKTIPELKIIVLERESN